jgi:hypothetical protein
LCEIKRSLTFTQDLGSFLLGYALDLFQLSSWGVGDRLDSLIAAIDDKLNVALGETGKTLEGTVVSFTAASADGPSYVPPKH